MYIFVKAKKIYQKVSPEAVILNDSFTHFDKLCQLIFQKIITSGSSSKDFSNSSLIILLAS